jgi:VWFA-related protein
MRLVTTAQITLLSIALGAQAFAGAASEKGTDSEAAAGYDVFRAGTDEVRLAFSVTDRHGAPVKSLGPTDVAVADDGWIIRHFRSFRSAGESPVDLVILLDTSDSVASELQQKIADIRKLLRNPALGARDRISILSFGAGKPRLLCERDCNEASAQARLEALRAGGETPLYDAMMLAAETLGQNRDSEARSAMLLFSDGEDTISMHSLPEALEAAQNLQAAIYCINTRPMKRTTRRGDATLGYLAAATGGLSYAPGVSMDEALRAVLEDLHSGYVLTYELPERKAGRHSVRLLPTSNRQLSFRSRQAYDDSSEQ